MTKDPSRFARYDRAAFLATVPEKHRGLAETLCGHLEAAFPGDDITLFSGFPVVVRDMEWCAGFAVRANGVVAYCCSPATMALMGDALRPYLSGKSCIAVKPRRGEALDVVVALVARAFHEAAKHDGMISKADARKREARRRAEG
ncbi:MAG: hypothetical protein JNK72_14865 [Myxococcales bacterium]|nr:hypothetical protein [Myxococcales bacterium]